MDANILVLVCDTSYSSVYFCLIIGQNNKTNESL